MTWLRTKLRKWLGIEEQQGHIHGIATALQIYNANIVSIQQAQAKIVELLEAKPVKAKKRKSK